MKCLCVIEIESSPERYILQLKLSKRLASKFLLCGSQTAVAEDIVIKQHLLRQVVHGSLLLSNDEAVHQV